MARTRAQTEHGQTQAKEDDYRPKKGFTGQKLKSQDERHKRKSSKGEEPTEKQSDTAESPSSKRLKKSDPDQDTTSQRPSAPTDTRSSNSNSTIEKLLSTNQKLPLQDLGISDPGNPTPSNMLAHVFNAMLTSARISHELATKSVKCLIEVKYHDLETLKKSSWEERTEVLTKGGYTRYREKTATGLGELANFIEEKYDGDLNNILAKTDSSPAKIRSAIKEIKGIGDVGVNIFFDNAQAAWPCLAPFIDPRSLETAENLGLGKDVGKLYEDLGKDPVRMCKLAAALTSVRLEKKESEFT